MLAPDATALVIALLARDRTRDPGQQLTLMGREVKVAAHRRELRLRSLAQVDEVLQLARVPVQSVRVVDDNGLDNPGVNVLQHPLVLGPALAAVGADVRIDITLDHLPAAPGGQLLAIGQLPTDREVIALTIRGDPRIDPSPDRHLTHIRRSGDI
ncbi:MAG: hypothetical protein M3Q31_26150 [Actinomycetota bacterium]|nr:hypothetical protein [Actinomycetota bacterium]